MSIDDQPHQLNTKLLLTIQCLGKQASFGERFQDNFLFTSADNAESERCTTLTKPSTLPAGAVTYLIPAGRYIGSKKNSTGYFYYAPKAITSSNSFFSFDQQGIYLNNQLNAGNVFGRNPTGYDNRPVRGAVLPSSIFAYIKRSSC